MTSQFTFLRSTFRSNSLGNFIVRSSFFSCRRAAKHAYAQGIYRTKLSFE